MAHDGSWMDVSLQVLRNSGTEDQVTGIAGTLVLIGQSESLSVGAWR